MAGNSANSLRPTVISDPIPIFYSSPVRPSRLLPQILSTVGGDDLHGREARQPEQRRGAHVRPWPSVQGRFNLVNGSGLLRRAARQRRFQRLQGRIRPIHGDAEQAWNPLYSRAAPFPSGPLSLVFLLMFISSTLHLLGKSNYFLKLGNFSSKIGRLSYRLNARKGQQRGSCSPAARQPPPSEA